MCKYANVKIRKFENLKMENSRKLQASGGKRKQIEFGRQATVQIRKFENLKMENSRKRRPSEFPLGFRLWPSPFCLYAFMPCCLVALLPYCLIAFMPSPATNLTFFHLPAPRHNH
jgi:hypothetical protein